MLCQKRLAFSGIAKEDEADFGMAFEGLGCAGDGDLRTEIATHDVDGNSDHASLAYLIGLDFLVSGGRGGRLAEFGQNTAFHRGHN